MKNQTTPAQLERIFSLAEELHQPDTKQHTNPFSERLEAIINSPESKYFLIRLMDVAFRSKNFDRVSAFIVRLFNSTDAHDDLFSFSESVLVRLYRMIGYKLPSVSIPLMLKQIQEVTGPMVYFLDDKRYKQHYHQRRKEGIKLNINLIGEALNGEAEAANRIENYISLLNTDEVDYISVKISTIYSQLEPIAHHETVSALVEKLSVLYHEVLRIKAQKGVTKFVNLDMEEYRDLSLTIDAFTQTLDLPEFKQLRAGIVIQAYLPDAFNEVLKLKAWAKKRVTNGGAAIKIRLVKGANLEMEQTEASMRQWPLATFSKKIESDANYKKILLELLTEDSVKSVNVGVASHNIFDLAFALDLIQSQNLQAYVDFEMLEGIASETVQVLLNKGMGLILYTPIVKKEDYNNAIAYLVRRLDEGTQTGNFLREGFNLDVNTAKWEKLKTEFTASIKQIETLKALPNRNQNRGTEIPKHQTEFYNVADTDWTVAANRAWIEKVRLRWRNPIKILGDTIPVVAEVGEKERSRIDQSNWKGPLHWHYELATEEDYSEVLAASSVWQNYDTTERVAILRKAACELEKNRGDLIGVAVEELGKTVAEVDVEISEAIDFANFYAQSALEIEQVGLAYEATGINLVISPWNFPIAIPAGGVLASLAAGKRVILKPSRNAAACSYLICQCLWKAGVPKSALAFLPTKSQVLNPFLSTGNPFDAIILTGGTDTAQLLLNRNPILHLYAETGGKNATIVTALADREQAIKNVVQSAFGNTGQKCSATSLLVLEKELFEDERFKQNLKDAAESKYMGAPWDFRTQIGPLAVPINDNIKHVIASTTDQEWLLKPTLSGDFLLSPGIKWGITKDDFGYKNELFGPILFVMEAEGLYDAINLVNGVEYGLTSGIESLAREEVRYWKEQVEAGNLYANRGTTGAIVLRQPFGGIKASCYGFGMKAGGVNYVLQFMALKNSSLKDMSAIAKDYKSAYLNHFSKETDYLKIRGQHNICRYIKPKQVRILIDEQTDEREVELIQIACDTLRVKAVFYALTDVDLPMEGKLVVLDTWEDISHDIDHQVIIRSRVKNLPNSFRKELIKHHIHIYERPVHAKGRVELLNYLTEQSISINYHRYGNLMGEKSL